MVPASLILPHLPPRSCAELVVLHPPDLPEQIQAITKDMVRIGAAR